MKAIWKFYNSGSIQLSTEQLQSSSPFFISPSGQLSKHLSLYCWLSRRNGTSRTWGVTQCLPDCLGDMEDCQWKVFFSQTKHTHIVNTLMAFFFEAVCVIRSLLSNNGESGRPVFDGLWMCSLHCSDVPDWACIDYSLDSSSPASQSFYVALSPV